MKKIAFFTGIISTLIVLIGLLLKFLKCSSANITITIGIVAFSLFFAPIMTKYIYDRPNEDEL